MTILLFSYIKKLKLNAATIKNSSFKFGEKTLVLWYFVNKHLLIMSLWKI